MRGLEETLGFWIHVQRPQTGPEVNKQILANLTDHGQSSSLNKMSKNKRNRGRAHNMRSLSSTKTPKMWLSGHRHHSVAADPDSHITNGIRSGGKHKYTKMAACDTAHAISEEHRVAFKRGMVVHSWHLVMLDKWIQMKMEQQNAVKRNERTPR